MDKSVVNVYVISSELGLRERAQQLDLFEKQFYSECPNMELKQCIQIEDADFVFLATGGVEGKYKALFKRDVTPTAFYAPSRSNAYAALNEIRAYLRKMDCPSFAFDKSQTTLAEFITASTMRRKLRQCSIAAVGEPAPWLIASIPSDDVISARFGVSINRVSWDELGWQNCAAQQKTTDKWNGCRRLEALSEIELLNACKLSSALRNWVVENKSSAVTVGCFPLLAQHVSACLTVADLLDSGIPAACENDICAVLAMMTAKLLGIANTSDGSLQTWMANLVDISGNIIMLQHCTIGLSMLREASVMTHFESHANVAVAGSLSLGPVTVFRFDDSLKYAFIAEGEIIESGPNSLGCRTSAKIKLNRDMPTPLGNHHIVIYNHHANILKLFCKFMNMTIV